MSFKISNDKENPFDLTLTSLANTQNPFFKATGHTPNILTTYSFVCGLLSVYFLYKRKLPLFSLLFIVSYFFDCCDGSFARRYRMESRFGDLYDHITDVVVFLLLLLVVALLYRKVVDLFAVLVFAFFGGMMLVHFGCQQKNCNNCEGKELLDNLKILCPNARSIWWSRFFGSGTFILVFILLVFYLDQKL